MGKTFKIGLRSLGGTWGLLALNAPILSKKLQVKGNSEAMGFLRTFQSVGKTFNKKHLNG